jgi:hypothetical protein
MCVCVCVCKIYISVVKTGDIWPCLRRQGINPNDTQNNDTQLNFLTAVPVCLTLGVIILEYHYVNISGIRLSVISLSFLVGPSFRNKLFEPR